MNQWRIPANRMKMREQHIVPLSGQAIEILREPGTVNKPPDAVQAERALLRVPERAHARTAHEQ